MLCIENRPAQKIEYDKLNCSRSIVCKETLTATFSNNNISNTVGSFFWTTRKKRGELCEWFETECKPKYENLTQFSGLLQWPELWRETAPSIFTSTIRFVWSIRVDGVSFMLIFDTIISVQAFLLNKLTRQQKAVEKHVWTWLTRTPMVIDGKFSITTTPNTSHSSRQVI